MGRNEKVSGCKAVNDAEKSESTKLVRTEVRFTPEVNQALTEISQEYGISKSQLIRIIVDKRMDEYLGTVKYIDREQGAEIKKQISDLQNTMSMIYTELHRIGVNYNQEVKRKNILRKYKKDVADVKAKYKGRMSMDAIMIQEKALAEIEDKKNSSISNLQKSNLFPNANYIENMIVNLEVSMKKAGDALWRILE